MPTPTDMPTNTAIPSTPTPTIVPSGTPAPTLTIAPTSAATALADNLGAQTGGAILSSGGSNSVVLGDAVGNLYARVMMTNGSELSPNAAAEIGIPSLISLGIQHAVNLFGMIENGIAANDFSAPIEICLRGTGEVMFVAAADATRTPVRLAAVNRDGYACVMVPSAGLLVMMSAPGGQTPQVSAPGESSAQADDTVYANACNGGTLGRVNLRAAPSPSGAILAQVPVNTLVTVTARNAAGYYLVSYGGQTGYVDADLMMILGPCA